MQKTEKGKNDEDDYVAMLSIVTEEDSQNPTWILRNLTPNQMEQIQKTWRTELFTATRQSIPKLYELMSFK